MRKASSISLVKSVHLNRRFFMLLLMAAVLFIISFAWSFVEVIARIYTVALVLLTCLEFFMLYRNKQMLRGARRMSRMFSLGDDNAIHLQIENRCDLSVRLSVFDEMPFQFQERKFHMDFELMAFELKELTYKLRPTERGEYHFGVINALATTKLGLISRHFLLSEPQMVPVYPSIIQMKKYELIAFARINTLDGIRRVRRLGHSYEFDQIKPYVVGDDVRSINWKATGRRNQLMVNHYEDERSQHVYSIIDKSRNMLMPFNGMTLLDYSINTSVVISNVVLKKHDRAGLITFSHLVGSTLRADKGELQLKKILESLYREKPQSNEADYELLYRGIKNVIRSRSLIFLYLNFESMYALERALPMLLKINHLHVLVIMLFENTELMEYSDRQVAFTSEIYAQTIARKLLNDKKQIAAKLRKYGIQTILTRPEDLSINTVNKYLELKAKGVI